MHKVTLPFADTMFLEDFGIFVAAQHEDFGQAWLSVGAPGLKNATATLSLNEVLLFEGLGSIFEIRLLSRTVGDVTVSVTLVQANLQAFYSFTEEYVENSTFTEDEREKISVSLKEIRERIESLSDINKEQVEYLSRKLDEILAGSQRFGRKDWINWSMGYLMNISSAISLDRKTTSAVGTVFSEALQWLRASGANLIDSGL